MIFFKEPEMFLHILHWIWLILTPIFSAWSYLGTKTWQFSESWHIVFGYLVFLAYFRHLGIFCGHSWPYLTLFYEIWYFGRFFKPFVRKFEFVHSFGVLKKIICQVWGARPRNEVFYALPNDKGQQRDLWLDARVDLSMIWCRHTAKLFHYEENLVKQSDAQNFL